MRGIVGAGSVQPTGKLSVSAYARHLGVTRALVQQALDRGRIAQGDDGLIDPVTADVAWEANRGEDRAAPMKGVSRAAVRSAKTALAEEGVETGERLTFVEAHTAHEIVKTHLARLKLAREKGELVDRAKAEAFVFRLFRTERDALVGWPSRVSALMASELGVGAHEMQQTLEKYARAYLSERAEAKIDLA